MVLLTLSLALLWAVLLEVAVFMALPAPGLLLSLRCCFLSAGRPASRILWRTRTIFPEVAEFVAFEAPQLALSPAWLGFACRPSFVPVAVAAAAVADRLVVAVCVAFFVAGFLLLALGCRSGSGFAA
jgi:hypothetical protein